MKSPRLRNRNLILEWIDGRSQITNHTKSLMVDEHGSLYSYRLKIGQRTDAGICVVADYTAPKNQFRSVTTSTHVGLAKRLISRSGGLIMHPLVWRTSPLSEPF
mgnify:FL=1